MFQSGFGGLCCLFFTKVSINANWSLSHRQEDGRMPASHGSSDT